MNTTKKVVNPGKIEGHNVFIEIVTEQKDKGLCLSIHGVVGPMRNGDAWGSCGQIQDSLKEIDAYAEGWNAESVQKLFDVWERWHLNDMNAACAHQKGPEWDTSRMISFIGYRKTDKADTLKKSAISGALSKKEYKLIEQFERYHGESLNDEQVPKEVENLIKAGYLEPWHWSHIEKTERAGFVYAKDGGLLCKPCKVCGYKYGSAWLFEEVPADVLAWLAALPATRITPAWV